MKNNNKNTSLTAKEYELLMTFNDLIQKCRADCYY